MAENSKIEWTDHTVNLWWGCEKVHTGCKNCYAEVLSNRFGNEVWGANTPRKPIRSAMSDLSKYQRNAFEAGARVKVFIGSMMDIFEDPKPLIGGGTTNDLRKKLFENISMGLYPNIIFLLLTKRPENILHFIPTKWVSAMPKNIWLGCSVSDQVTWNLTHDICFPSNSNKFVSIEPQIGPIDKVNLKSINWVIQGGESGNKNRPFDLDWAKTMKAMCETQKVPYFFKQIDKITPIPEHLKIQEFPFFN